MNELKEQSQQIKDDKYELLLESINDDAVVIPKSILPMKERCQLLNLTSVEEVNEYKELIEDSDVLEHFFNYNGLKKDMDYCEMKVRDTVNNKMITGVEKTRWFKIKYVHMLAKLCSVDDNLFSIEDITMPKLTDKNKKLITSIKKLYNKRDKVEVDDYDIDESTIDLDITDKRTIIFPLIHILSIDKEEKE